MMASEQAVREWDAGRKLLLLSEFLDAYEDYFDKHAIALVMKFPTCSFTGRAAYAVARRRKLPTLIINTGPIVTDSFTLNDIDEGWLWSEFFEMYNDTGFVLTDERKKAVDEMVERVMSDKKKSLTVKKARPLGVIYGLFKYAYGRLRGDIDYVERNEVRKEASFLLGRMRPPVNYCKVDSSKPYVFFPLHIPWDAQIATRNPMFYSQEAVVEMLARALPPGVTLYIKEHPYYAGGVNRKMLRGLRKFEAVKVLDPSITSIEAIRGASAVVAINSTAGWETILLRKPLVVLGNPYYAYFKHAYRLENINSLPKVLNEALSRAESVYDDTDEWYKFLYSAAFSARKGSMVLYKKYMGFDEDLGGKRIKQLSDEMEKKIRGLLKRQGPTAGAEVSG